MSREELEYMPLREMLSRHISDSQKRSEDMHTTLTQLETHMKYQIDAIKDHDCDIESLKAQNERQKGAIAVVGFLGLSGLLAAVKHFIFR